jgi:hypothetical protein
MKWMSNKTQKLLSLSMCKLNTNVLLMTGNVVSEESKHSGRTTKCDPRDNAVPKETDQGWAVSNIVTIHRQSKGNVLAAKAELFVRYDDGCKKARNGRDRKNKIM